jgi:acyl carrier protein
MQAEYVAPQTDTEQKLAVIWQQLLGVERVGRHDNFFDLGGHSLLLTRLVSQIQKQFTIDDLSVRDIFHSQTISDQALDISYQLSVNMPDDCEDAIVNEEW